MAITSFTRNALTAAHADLSWCGAAVPNTPTARARIVRIRNVRIRNAKARIVRIRNARIRNAKARIVRIRNVRIRNAKARIVRIRNVRIRNAKARIVRIRNVRIRNAKARIVRIRNVRIRNAKARIVYNMHGPDISVIGLNAFSQSWDQTIPALQTACPSIIRART